MANYPIEDIEGIGPTYGEKLKAAGIPDTDTLLVECKLPAGRKGIAEKTGIADKLILEWTNHCDLYRITGVGSEFADLLEAAGVDTVPELAQRNAANLAAKLAEVNEAKNLTRRVPSEADCEKWIAEAKTLPRMIEY